MDEDAFCDLVAARFPAWRRTAYLLCRDWQLAEDLVQSAVVDVWSRLRRPGDVTSSEAYVRAAVVNRYLSWRRLRSSSEQVGVDAHDRALAAGDDALVERDAMWQRLAGLPPKQRAVLVLSYYEDLSERQVAEALRCSVGTVKSHRARGLAALRAQVGTNEEAR